MGPNRPREACGLRFPKGYLHSGCVQRKDMDKVNLMGDVFENIIRKFFANAIVEGDHINCWLRGKEFSITRCKVMIFYYVFMLSLFHDKMCCNCFNFIPCILWDFIVLGLVLSW